MQTVPSETAALGLSRTTERWDNAHALSWTVSFILQCFWLSLQIEGLPLMLNQEWGEYPLLALWWVPWMVLFHVEDHTDRHLLTSTHRGDRGAFQWCLVSSILHNITPECNKLVLPLRVCLQCGPHHLQEWSSLLALLQVDLLFLRHHLLIWPPLFDSLPPPSVAPLPPQQTLPFPPHTQVPQEGTPPPEGATWPEHVYLSDEMVDRAAFVWCVWWKVKSRQPSFVHFAWLMYRFFFIFFFETVTLALVHHHQPAGMCVWRTSCCCRVSEQHLGPVMWFQSSLISTGRTLTMGTTNSCSFARRVQYLSGTSRL